jgi:hypothetical protein
LSTKYHTLFYSYIEKKLWSIQLFTLEGRQYLPSLLIRTLSNGKPNYRRSDKQSMMG